MERTDQPPFTFVHFWAHQTNTYQAIIATDEIRTYAMFNYERIDWITAMDNYDGMKGFPAYVSATTCPFS